MSKQLEGKIALITGGSRGIGAAIANQGSDHESGAERWQSAVHVESVIRLQVV